MAALDVKGPTRTREPKDQTARAIFIAGVVFNEFARCDGFTKFLDSDAAKDTLVHGMLGKLEVPGRDLVLDRLNQLHALPRYLVEICGPRRNLETWSPFLAMFRD